MARKCGSVVNVRILEGYYDEGTGWELICECEDREEAVGLLKCYNYNEKQYQHRIRTVRQANK